MTVTGEPVREIQGTVKVGLNPEVIGAGCYKTVAGIEQSLN